MLALRCSGPVIISLLVPLVGCAVDADESERPGPDWVELSPGHGLDDAGLRPTAPGTAAYYVSATDHVYRLDGPAVPLPPGITSIPGSEVVAAVPIEDLPRSSLIFDGDSRMPFTSDATLKGYNKRTIGELETAVGQCTGSLIGPRQVLTSAHCVLDNGNFTSAGAIHFSPGSRGLGFGTTDPNGVSRSAVGYFARSANDTWDYALIILKDEAVTASLSWMGLVWSTDDDWYEGRTVSLVGYPGTLQNCAHAVGPTAPLCGGFQYGEGCPIDDADEDLEFECDVTNGQSGSPLYAWFDGVPALLGVVRGSSSTPFNSWNKAVRLTSTKVGDLCSWIGSSPSAFAFRPCP